MDMTLAKKTATVIVTAIVVLWLAGKVFNG